MKLLAFSDIHADVRAALNLVQRSANVDVVVGAGDYGMPRQDLREIISALKQIKKPTVLVSGNCETTEALKEACLVWQNVHVLHGEQVTINGMSFYGIGGGIPITPFGPWSYDFSEEEASHLLKNSPSGGVLISHSPPKGILDISSDGRQLGSTALRDAIIVKKPLLVICGHIHASAGQIDRFGETPIINAGPGGIFWDLMDNMEVKL